MATKGRNGKWIAREWIPATHQIVDGEVVHVKGHHRWIKECNTKREALRLEKEAKERKASLNSEETCGEFAVRWPDDYPRPRESTKELYRDKLKPFISDFYNVKPRDIDRPTARAWALQFPHAWPVVRTMFNDLVNDGYLLHNVWANMRLPGSKGRKNIIALTEEELHTFADMALDIFGDYGPRLRAMVIFDAYVGLRAGELYASEITDIDGEEICVSRQMTKHGVQLPKNGLIRDIVVPPPALEVLDDIPLFDGPMFRTIRGKVFSKSGLNHYWNPLRAAFTASLPKRHWLPRRVAEFGAKGMFDVHELRHFCATQLLELGNTPMDVAHQLGHTDGGILVMELYGHPSEAKTRRRLLDSFKVKDERSCPTCGVLAVA